MERNELEHMALNIARNAVPVTPAGEGAGADAAARLNMAAAVAERAKEHDSTDPLGRGRIDTRLLTLVSSVHAVGDGQQSDARVLPTSCVDNLNALLLACRPKGTAAARRTSSGTAGPAAAAC